MFHNLGSLKQIVHSEIDSCKGSLHSQIKSCLDVQALSNQQTGPQGRGKRNSQYEMLLNTLIPCSLMDFPIQIDTISMGLPIVYFKGSQVVFSKS